MLRGWGLSGASRAVRGGLTGPGTGRKMTVQKGLVSPFHQDAEGLKSTMSTRKIDVEEVNGVTVAKFTDKKILDETNIQIIANQLFSLIDDDHRKKIVLDFATVEYLSSAALGKLITLDKKVKADKGELRLCTIRKDILEVFKITKLDKLFKIFETREKALAGF
jgi:anti-sigma B factor antagonist